MKPIWSFGQTGIKSPEMSHKISEQVETSNRIDVDRLDGCEHTVTQGRTNEKGYWCKSCGEKIFAVDSRPCGECKHYLKDVLAFSGKVGICKLKLIRVIEDMHVTYKIADGTCWTDE